MKALTICVDGASRGNPGAAGIGVVVYGRAGRIVSEISEYIGRTTNNVAEYTALIRGLEEALRLGATSVRIRTDSQLLARQIAGTYRVKAGHLAPLFQRARALLGQFDRTEVVNVPREDNALADKLASKAAGQRPEADREEPSQLTLM